MHAEQLAEHGGLMGLRDRGLLESALARPRNAWTYGETDLAELAALYAGGICRNHPSSDGNKRAAFLAAFTFLFINGQLVDAREGEVAAFTMGLAGGEIDERVYAAWLRDNLVSR